MMRKFLHRLWRRAAPGSNPDREIFQDALQPGDRVGHDHTITGHLGAGGFGYTYSATRSDGASVALKECFPAEYCRRSGTHVGLRAQDEADALHAIQSKFAGEAAILRSLDHPHIVKGGNLIEANI